MKNLTWQNPEQLFVAQELINKVKSKCCGIKDDIKLVATGENAGAFDVTPVYKKIEDGKLVDGTETDGELVGWTIALKPNTAIQNGATITFDLNITDKWGVELPAQKVSLTVKK